MLEKLNPEQLNQKFEDMLNDMNLSDEKKEPLRQQPLAVHEDDAFRRGPNHRPLQVSSRFVHVLARRLPGHERVMDSLRSPEAVARSPVGSWEAWELKEGGMSHVIV